MKQKKIEVYDSQCETGMDPEASKVAKAFYHFVGYVCESGEGHSLDDDMVMQNWDDNIYPMYCPRQPDNVGCGIFVILNLHCLQAGLPCNYNDDLKIILKRIRSYMLIGIISKTCLTKLGHIDVPHVVGKLKAMATREKNKMKKIIENLERQNEDEKGYSSEEYDQNYKGTK